MAGWLRVNNSWCASYYYYYDCHYYYCYCCGYYHCYCYCYYHHRSNLPPSSAMSLNLLREAPSTIEPSPGGGASTTPATFDGGPAPVLRWYAPDACVRLSTLPAAIHEATLGPAPRNGVQAEGQVWITDAAIHFLPAEGTGFSLAHPGITLHALTRSLPPGLSRLGSITALYIHIDDSPDQDDDEESESSLTEMWMLLKSTTEAIEAEEGPTLQQAFDAVSYAATLVPSSAAAADSNPLAALGPFGTGSAGPCGIVDDDPAPNGNQQEDDPDDGPGRARSDLQTPDQRFRPY